MTFTARVPGSVTAGSEIARTGIKNTNAIMKAVIQAVFPWKATGLDTFSGEKNDRVIHNSVPNSKQRRKLCLFEGLIRQGQTGIQYGG